MHLKRMYILILWMLTPEISIESKCLIVSLRITADLLIFCLTDIPVNVGGEGV